MDLSVWKVSHYITDAKNCDLESSDEQLETIMGYLHRIHNIDVDVKDNVKIFDNVVDRDKYIQIACPQGFRFEYLLDIYQRAEDKGIVDKTEPHTISLIYALGDNVNYAYGDQTNIKITTKEDIKLFEGYALMEKLSDKGELRCQQKN